MLAAIAQALAPRWVLANTAGGGVRADPVIRQNPAYFEEFLLRPLAHHYVMFEDVAAEFQRRAHLDTIGVLPTPAEVKAFLADLLICRQATLNSLRRVRERWRDSRACLTLHRSRREMLLQLLTNHFDSITHRSQFGCGYSTTHVTETAVGHHQ